MKIGSIVIFTGNWEGLTGSLGVVVGPGGNKRLDTLAVNWVICTNTNAICRGMHKEADNYLSAQDFEEIGVLDEPTQTIRHAAPDSTECTAS